MWWWLLLFLAGALQVTLIALKVIALQDHTVYELPVESGRDLSGEAPFQPVPSEDASVQHRVTGHPDAGSEQQGRVDVWDRTGQSRTSRPLQEILGTKAQERFGKAVSMSASGMQLVVASRNRVHVYRQVEADRTYAPFDTFKVKAESVQALDDGFYVVTSDKVQRFWTDQGGTHEHVTLVALGGGSVHSNGHRTVVGLPNETDYRGDAIVLDAYGAVQRLRCPAGEGAAFGSSVAMSPSGQWVAVGAPRREQAFLYQWNGINYDLVQTLTSGKGSDHFGLHLDLDDKTLSVSGHDQTLTWRHTSRRQKV